MDLNKLRVPDLVELCEDLGITVGKAKRKPHLIELITKTVADESELVECWELIQERRNKEAEEREREKQREEKQRAHELEVKRLELEMKKLEAQSSERGSSQATARGVETFRMKDLMQPFKVGEDVGLFLVNFERTCEKVEFSRESWSQRLLTLLPCEAADVIARMNKQDAEDYDKVKSALLKKYRLSTEAFRQRFRNASKGPKESYPEFAYNLKANLVEWLKSAEAYGNHGKVIECIALEQFFSCVPEQAKFWVQDRLGEPDVQKAAELTEEYATRRAFRERPFKGNKGGKGNNGGLPKGHERREDESEGPKNDGSAGESSTEAKESEGKSKQDNTRAFESKRLKVCYKCKKPGHIAAQCEKKVVFSCVSENDENAKLLEPYIKKLTVNGKECKVLRDSAATMDVIHPSYVGPSDLTGDCAWIRQVAEENSVCLPIAKVSIEGPFGILETEAAVSPNLPLHYPYLFSNKSDQMLRERGQCFSVEVVQALTRSKARQLASQMTFDQQVDIAEPARDDQSTEPREQNEGSVQDESVGESDNVSTAQNETSGSEDLGASCTILPPTSKSFQALALVDRATLVSEQNSDPSLVNLRDNVKEGVSRKNIKFYVKSDVLYRQYKDRNGRVCEQLVVPEKYRKDLLELSHGNSWSGHLGIRKTKARLTTEYYWPGIWKDVENWVKSCDTCQRVGKSTDKLKAPMRLVPVITEPFRRLVIDIVGPLPATQDGHRYILTALCPATKFPEAVPLRELSSAQVVDALLSIFARVGFPAEIQSDNGSVFTSQLTTTFLERCGMKIIHSSVHHPQSNAVERMHSVLKRVLRALCYEHKTDWESCLPATMFALRSVPHETTGFSPAELVYGRTLRTPLRMLKESWEGYGEDPTVVQYVLDLLNRLHDAREVVEANMTDAQQKAKAYYDKSAKARTFNVDERVMVLKPSKQNKLDIQWEGPARVVQKLSSTTYAIKMEGRRKDVTIYHSNLMKPYREREAIVNLALNTPEELTTDIPIVGEPIEFSIEELMTKMGNCNTLQPEQLSDVKSVLQEFQGVFSSRPGKTSLIEHDIELVSDAPVRSRPYRVSPRQKEIMEAEVKRMLELGVIEPAESDFTSPLILVEVPGKDPRPCVDYRKLNAITRDQTYPIPNIEERVEKVSRAKFISTLDLVRGYWQVPLSERASRYAAFVSPLGTFRPKMLSFGLKNAPFCFSNLMDRVLNGLGDFAVPYLDDIAIFSDTWADHVEHLRAVLERLRDAGLTVRAEKCQIGKAEVSYLGHIVGQGCRRPADVKITAVTDYPRPTTKTEIRAFLGLAGYYQHYIRDYSNIASPLTDALRKTEPNEVKWDDVKEKAFCSLKEALTNRPVLAAPDYNRTFIVQCDASDRGVGAVLCQLDERGRERPILFISRKLTGREQTYSASEKECACLVWAIQKLSCYLAGSRFVVETDHCPLTWLQQMSSKNGRLLRWSLTLQPYNFEIRYKRGSENGNADGLSRSFQLQR